MCRLHQNPQERVHLDEPPTRPSRDTAALRFWEIEPFFRCPLIGLCLTPGEQKQVLKKAGFPLKNKRPYDIHETLTAAAESETRLSRRVDGLLHRKFGRRAKELHWLPVADFMRCWKAAFESGAYLAEFWTAASRRDLPAESRKEIYGAIHMAMHAHAEQSAHGIRRLGQLKRKTADQEKRIKDLRQDRRALRKENGVLKGMLGETNEALERMLTAARSSLFPRGRGCGPVISPAGTENQESIMALEKKNRLLAAANTEQAAQLRSKDRELEKRSQRIALLSKDLENEKKAAALFKKETQLALGAFFEMNSCDAGCPAFDLCRKRVLIVGGISRMEALYRELIEKSGGVFEYHDGHMNGGAKQLESRLRRSDIVLCPVNCNSHAACSMVKNLGKKHKKRVHMLPSFSLSAVSRAILADGNGQAPAN